MKKAAPKMTLEKLAMMVAGGFARIEERFATKGEVTEGFKSIDKRFEKIDKDLQMIRGEILKQGDKFVSQDVFNSRISALETKVKAKAR